MTTAASRAPVGGYDDDGGGGCGNRRVEGVVVVEVVFRSAVVGRPSSASISVPTSQKELVDPAFHPLRERRTLLILLVLLIVLLIVLVVLLVPLQLEELGGGAPLPPPTAPPFRRPRGQGRHLDRRNPRGRVGVVVRVAASEGLGELTTTARPRPPPIAGLLPSNRSSSRGTTEVLGRRMALAQPPRRRLPLLRLVGRGACAHTARRGGYLTGHGGGGRCRYGC